MSYRRPHNPDEHADYIEYYDKEPWSDRHDWVSIQVEPDMPADEVSAEKLIEHHQRLRGELPSQRGQR